MAHDVFISYSTKDKQIADAMVNFLENNKMRCWYAPRDIAPGMPWPTAIANALRAAHAMVLIFSEHSNASKQVAREITLADSNQDLMIVPFRITDVKPTGDMSYYLSNTHWLDAVSQKHEVGFANLLETIVSICKMHGETKTQLTTAVAASSNMIEAFRQEVIVFLEDGVLDEKEEAMLRRMRDMCGLNEETAEQIIEEEKVKLAKEEAGEPDRETFRAQVREYVVGGTLSDTDRSEIARLSENYNLEEADAEHILQEELAEAAKAKYRAELREVLADGVIEPAEQRLLDMMKAHLNLDTETVERLMAEERNLLQAETEAHEEKKTAEAEESDVPGKFLSARDMGKILSSRFSEDESNQLRERMGIELKSGKISERMVNSLLHTLGYLRRTTDASDWECTEAGHVFCQQIESRSKDAKDLRFRRWNDLLLSEIEDEVRRQIAPEAGEKQTCVTGEYEDVIQSFSRIQQKFLRVLLARSLADTPVLTREQILQIAEEVPELSYPQWLTSAKLGPEYQHPERGKYLNPIQVRIAAMASTAPEAEFDADSAAVARSAGFLGNSFLSARNIAKVLSETFSESECNQLRERMEIGLMSGRVSERMVNNLLCSMGYLQRSSEDNDWECTESGLKHCNEIISQTKDGKELRFRRWSDLMVLELTAHARELIGNEAISEKEGGGKSAETATVPKEPISLPDPLTAEFVKLLRERIGLNQTELARRLEVSPASISIWEGKVGPIKPGNKAQIALSKLLAERRRALDLPDPVTAEYIRTLREDFGLNQSAFARLLGLSPATISQWESREGPINMRSNTRQALGDILAVL